MKPVKPIGRKAYGSIGHLPSSRLGPKDYCIPSGQALIATEKSRDKYDSVIVQEKLDGSCVAVARLGSDIIALGRAGYPASTSPYEQHLMFDRWVTKNRNRFERVLLDGERIVGEWIAQAHGTIYEIPKDGEPFIAFDIMRETSRLPVLAFLKRVSPVFETVEILSYGEPISVEKAMEYHNAGGRKCDQTEGVVYRVERKGVVDFLCKWVRPDKVDGKYLPEISGCGPVWNWRPEPERNGKHE